MDRLRLRSALKTLRRNIENIYCENPAHDPGCQCPTLGRLYGPSPFHCDKPFCERYHTGFGSRAARDEHLKTHTRPFLCSETGCMFAKTGFHTKEALARHEETHSHYESIREALSSGTAIVQDQEDTLAMFEDALFLGDISVAQNIITQQHQIDWDTFREVLCIAAWKASADNLAILLRMEWNMGDRGRPALTLASALAVAIETKNRPNIKVLLTHGADLFENVRLPRSFDDRMFWIKRVGRGGHQQLPDMAGYARAISLWDPDLMSFLVDECGIAIPSTIESVGALGGSPAVKGLTRDELAVRFSAMRKYTPWPSALNEGMCEAWRFGSLEVFRVCLENGADPNYMTTLNTFRTARQPILYQTLAKPIQCTMEMAVLLLKHGADPSCSKETGRKLTITSLLGMKKLEAYFGLSWDEVVRRAQAGEDISPVSRHNGGNRKAWVGSSDR
jgi:hypothetical protein